MTLFRLKKKTIKDENISVSEKYDRVKNDGTYNSLSSQSLPNKTDVFLGDTAEFNKRAEFNNKVNDFSVSDLQTAEVVNNNNSVPDISVDFNVADYMPNLDKTNKKFMRSQTLNLHRIKLKYQVCHMKHLSKTI